MNVQLITDDRRNYQQILSSLSEFDATHQFYDEMSLKSLIDTDIVVLDLDTSMFETLITLETIHKKYHNMKIIILAIDPDMKLLVHSYTLGTIDCVRKPYFLSEIESKINQFADNKKSS